VITGSIFYIVKICYYLPQPEPVPEIKVTLPDDAAELKLTLCPGSNGEITVFDMENNLLQIVAMTDMDASGLIHIVQSTGAIRSALLSGGQFILKKACFLSTDEASNLAYYNSTKTLNETLLHEIWDKTSADIFSPNKFYRVKVTTRTERKKSNADDWESPISFVEYTGFKTGDPPGITDGSITPTTSTDSQKTYPDGGPLATLESYILRTIPEAAGASDPQYKAYRSYDTGLQYNESYVSQLYLDAGYYLKIQLRDNNGDLVTDESGAAAYIINLWEAYTQMELTTAQTLFKELTEDCIGLGTAEPSTLTVDLSQVTPLLLEAGKQYTASLVATNGSLDFEVYSYNFITSQFVSFRHHAGSFLNAAWDHFSLQGNETYSINTTDLNTVLETSLDDSMKMEQLAGVFSIPVSRPLPAVMEVTALGDGSGIMGLLLESPEPIDWERIELTAASADGSTIVEVADADIMVNNACIETSTDPNDQFIELLMREKADLSGFTVEYQPGTSTAPVLFYTFPGGSNYEEGSLLRIFAGTDPGTGEITEDIHLYAGLSIVPFDGTTTAIDLKNAAGNSVYIRSFLPEAMFTSITCTRISSADGTRTYLFVPKSSAWSFLKNGNYRLTLTFKRDIGSDNPVLLRHGFKTDEKAHLEFGLPCLLPDV